MLMNVSWWTTWSWHMILVIQNSFEGPSFWDLVVRGPKGSVPRSRCVDQHRTSHLMYCWVKGLGVWRSCFTDQMAVFGGRDLCRMKHFTYVCAPLTVPWRVCALGTSFHLTTLPPCTRPSLAYVDLGPLTKQSPKM
jgi:hypothetical protein